MATKNLFEVATRKQFRFPSIKGDLTVEALWQVPLRSTDGFNLNEIAKKVNATVKVASEENFVDGAVKTAAQTKAKQTLDLVKYVIDVKLEEDERSKTRAKNKAEMETLLAALDRKQEAALEGMDEKAIKKKIAALSADLDDEE